MAENFEQKQQAESNGEDIAVSKQLLAELALQGLLVSRELRVAARKHGDMTLLDPADRLKPHLDGLIKVVHDEDIDLHPAVERYAERSLGLEPKKDSPAR